MHITTPAIMIFVVGLIILSLGLIIYLLSRNSKSAKYFSILCFMTSLWSFSEAVNLSIISIQVANIFIRLSHLLGIIISSIFVLFALLFINKKIRIRLFFIAFIVSTLFFSYFIFFTNRIVTNPFVLINSKYFGWGYGILWPFYDLYFDTCWLIGFVAIIRSITVTKVNTQRKNLILILVAFIIGVVPASITALVLPKLGIFEYNYLSTFPALLWIPIIAYAITKNNLFNIRLIAIQLAVYALWISIAIRMFDASNNHEMLIEGMFLLTTVILGLFLIKNTLSTLNQRDRIKTLSEELAEAQAEIKELSRSVDK